MPRLLCIMVLALLVAAPAALAGTRANIINDCFDDGKLDGNYTASQIRDARSNLPADIDQYSDCRDVLGRALGGTGARRVGGAGSGGGDGATGAGAGAGGGGAGGGGTTGGAPLTASGPAEQQALEAAARSGGPVQLGDTSLLPGAAGLASGAARNELPESLIVVLILLGLTALAAAVPYARRRVHARRHP